MLNIILCFLLIQSAFCSNALAADSWSVKESSHTGLIKKIEASWPLKGLGSLSEQSEVLKLEAVQDEAHPFWIGAIQMESIKAPLSTVAKSIDHFPGYIEIFDDLKKSEVRDQKTVDSSEWFKVFFEVLVPVPLVPNDKSEMIYQVTKTGDTRKVYRYQLHEGSNLVTSDGMIILDALSSSLTRYVEIDFFNADWGIAKTLGVEKIWTNSLQSLVQSDLAFKLQAEHLDWKNEQVLKESVKMAKAYPLAKRFKDRVMEKVWVKNHEL